ncbi:MAG: hypothetical protein QNJ63_06910 [Calothrix sp. MO_192.B10]|nr:hypothetical protein [Calothrix sp. MO_192.B10]
MNYRPQQGHENLNNQSQAQSGNDSDIQQFVQASEILTGFSAFDLYGTGQVIPYYLFVKELAPQALSQLLVCMENLPQEEEERDFIIRAKVLSDPVLGPLARRLIKLWYLGEWDGANQNQLILSAESYQEGLVWQAIGAHPQGAKQQGFGAWADPPVQL